MNLNLRITQMVDLPKDTVMTPVQVINPLIQEMFRQVLGGPAGTIETSFDHDNQIAKCYSYQSEGKYVLIEVLPEQEEPDRDPPEYGESQGM